MPLRIGIRASAGIDSDVRESGGRWRRGTSAGIRRTTRGTHCFVGVHTAPPEGLIESRRAQVVGRLSKNADERTSAPTPTPTPVAAAIDGGENHVAGRRERDPTAVV